MGGCFLDTSSNVNITDQPTSESVILDILSRDPDASLQQIRRSHPIFDGMSPDRLSVTLARVIDGRRASWLK